VAGLQLALGTWKRNCLRCLLGSAALVLAALAFPLELTGPSPFREIIALHLAVVAVLLIGAFFGNRPPLLLLLGRALRTTGPALVLLASLGALFGWFDGLLADDVPSGVIRSYPPLAAGLLIGYGLVLRHRASLGIAGLVLVCWLGQAGWWCYWALRGIVAGLDHMALGLLLLGLAVLVSLGKSGALFRLRSQRATPEGPQVPDSAG
jgi:hypothetical protein